MNRVIYNLLLRKITIAKWQLNLFGFLIFSCGALFGLYVLGNEIIIPRLFAASSPWTQTDWSNGEYLSINDIDTTSSGQFNLLDVGEKFTNTDFEIDLSSWNMPVLSSGGTITTSGNYRIHTFKSSGIFETPYSNNVEVLVVGGGGGGGGSTAGGGGGGGVIYDSSYEINSGSITVTVGNGGSQAASQTSGKNGENSIFDSLVAIGGGGGGYTSSSTNGGPGLNGGSGGGGARYGAKTNANGLGTVGQGYDGGTYGTDVFPGGGGGGAGGVGFAPTISKSGNGGIGVSSSISGSLVYYAGGGGGGSQTSGGDGGLGGGGAGTSNGNAGFAGTPNTGGGGGGGWFYASGIGGAGGSGIVIVRYLDPTSTQDTNIKYTGAASAKLVGSQNFTQNINVGDTSQYNLSVFAYTDSSAVDSSSIELFYNGETVSTTYTDQGDGWYRLSGTVIGANDSRQFGVQVKANKTVYVDDFNLSRYASLGILTSSIFDAGFASDWGNLTYITSGTGTVTVKVRSSNDAAMVGATAFDACTGISSGSDLSSSGGCVSDTHQYLQYQVTLESSGASTPAFSEISIAFSPSDQIAPEDNATNITMLGVGNTSWINTFPTIIWTEGVDNQGGGGILGYCLSLDAIEVGQSAPNNDPASSSGVLPPNGVHSNCPFVIDDNGTELDLSDASTVGVGFTLVSNYQYYFSIKAIDIAGNIYGGETQDYQNLVSFKYDNSPPTNPSALSAPQTYQSNVDNITIYWTTSGVNAATDVGSQIKGYQYRIGTTGIWYGSNHSGQEDCNDLITSGFYTLDSTYDSLTQGENIFYLRTYDNTCNVSSTTITATLKYSGSAPTEVLNLRATPSINTDNSFAFSWDKPSTFSGQESGLRYCYTVNAHPSELLCEGNWISTTSLAASAYATQYGENFLDVVAKDEAGNVNYFSYSEVNFSANTSAPGAPRNADIADISIKATSNWKLTVSWDSPEASGSGISTYKVYRSTTASSNCSTSMNAFDYIGATKGSSYSDTGLIQQNYYYCVKACDSANNCSAPSGTVSELPTGKYTSASSLSSGPTTSSITTKKAKISWSTDRNSDSKVQYGTSSGTYFDEEPSNSTQTTDHTINLNSLSPGTTYYYKAKWTDEDGNTGTSEEKSFKTTDAPLISNVTESDISISSGLVTFTTKDTSKATILFGKSTTYGGSITISTSTDESTYSVKLTGLDDGIIYHYKFQLEDVDGNKYEYEDHQFETLPRPKITNVRIQEVRGTAQPTVLVTWTTNTEVSSVITYYPLARPEDARDEINVTMTKGDHKMILKGLLTQTDYIMLVKGRDKVGNEAISDRQQFTTATDTRPPSILNLKIEGSSQAPSSSSQSEISQLIVTWSTDEPATSQVEYGEGSGETYSQKTQEDTNLTVNHLVVISGLTPSKVYHLRALSKDNGGNTGQSIDTATITPKSSDNAFDLVITNLSEAFSFLGGLRK